jgi:hypothetical protein
VAVACLFLHNFLAAIQPGSHPGRHRAQQHTRYIAERTEPEARIYLIGKTQGFAMGKFYLPYFAHRQARVVSWILSRSEAPFPQPLLAALAGDRDRPVYVLAELLEPGPALDELAASRRLDPAEVIALFQSLGPEPAGRMDDGFALYRLRFSGP